MSVTVSPVKIERWLRAHTRATAATLAPPATLERLDHAAVLRWTVPSTPGPPSITIRRPR